MSSKKLKIEPIPKIEPVRCLGPGRCIWYDMVEGNTKERGLCGYDLSLEDPTFFMHGYFKIKESSKIKKIRPGKSICQHRFPGMYNYSEPEFI